MISTLLQTYINALLAICCVSFTHQLNCS
uniref:Uncharacterized protein n=1 Tax=Arundo donax TaxID=35708 RepID=A0A0A8YHL2_ARUDO